MAGIRYPVRPRTKYLILIRNPSAEKVFVITAGGGRLDAILYDSEEKAMEAAEESPICRAWPYSIVEAP